MSTEIDPTLLARLRAALVAGPSDLEGLVRTLRAEGMSADDLQVLLEAFRVGLSEPQEEMVLDILDLVVGWCSPHMRIE